MSLKAVAILGPTGSGKTDLSIRLAGRYGEIISVDSRQVYRLMDIGTAKPTRDQQAQVPHHLIDVISPDQRFSAADFQIKALQKIEDITGRNRFPFLTGGTGLYFNTLIKGISNIPSIEPHIRQRVLEKWLKNGQSRMYQILSRIDADYARVIKPGDSQRTQRALEVFLQTGKTFSSYHQNGFNRPDVDLLLIGINLDRSVLYDRINRRVDRMMEEGLLNEVRGLLQKGYKPDDPGLTGIGYRELCDCLNGKLSLDEAVFQIKQNSRRYAKRQLTWFRAVADIHWIGPEDDSQAVKLIENWSGVAV
jgi:tRNA dimethylallyltransferase